MMNETSTIPVDKFSPYTEIDRVSPQSFPQKNATFPHTYSGIYALWKTFFWQWIGLPGGWLVFWWISIYAVQAELSTYPQSLLLLVYLFIKNIYNSSRGCGNVDNSAQSGCRPLCSDSFPGRWNYPPSRLMNHAEPPEKSVCLPVILPYEGISVDREPEYVHIQPITAIYEPVVYKEKREILSKASSIVYLI